jgi:nucleoside-diphosphate kinase
VALGWPPAGTFFHPLPKEHAVAQRTLVLVKPDGVQRGLVGEIVGRLERKGFTILAMELRTLERDVASRHYAEHEGKPFFDDLVDFITSAPLVGVVVEGHRAVEAVRMLMGVTDPVASAPGSIRGDYALEIGQNLVHGSDSEEAAAREIALFFPTLA